MFLPNFPGATFIPGATSIPESRVVIQRWQGLRNYLLSFSFSNVRQKESRFRQLQFWFSTVQLHFERKSSFFKRGNFRRFFWHQNSLAYHIYRWLIICSTHVFTNFLTKFQWEHALQFSCLFICNCTFHQKTILLVEKISGFFFH